MSGSHVTDFSLNLINRGKSRDREKKNGNLTVSERVDTKSVRKKKLLHPSRITFSSVGDEKEIVENTTVKMRCV